MGCGGERDTARCTWMTTMNVSTTGNPYATYDIVINQVTITCFFLFFTDSSLPLYEQGEDETSDSRRAKCLQLLGTES